MARPPARQCPTERGDRSIQHAVQKGDFPEGELNDRRVNAVEEAIKVIEAATTQPELREHCTDADRGQLQ